MEGVDDGPWVEGVPEGPAALTVAGRRGRPARPTVTARIATRTSTTPAPIRRSRTGTPAGGVGSDPSGSRPRAGSGATGVPGGSGNEMAATVDADAADALAEGPGPPAMVTKPSRARAPIVQWPRTPALSRR